MASELLNLRTFLHAENLLSLGYRRWFSGNFEAHFRVTKSHELYYLERNVRNFLEEGETPEFAGKAVVALAKDPTITKKSGRVLIAADLGMDYKFSDTDGKFPFVNYPWRIRSEMIVVWELRGDLLCKIL